MDCKYIWAKWNKNDEWEIVLVCKDNKQANYYICGNEESQLPPLIIGSDVQPPPETGGLDTP